MIPPRSILAAVDFSEPSRVALGMAVRLANHCGAALHVLHAEDPLLAAAARARGLDIRRDTHDELAAFVRSAPAARRPARAHVVPGAAGDVVRDIAVRERADVIVMGVRGMGAAEHALFGSTTESVLRYASTSVLAVPETWMPPRPDTDDLTGLGPVIAAVDFGQPSLEAALAAGQLAAALHAALELAHVVAGLPVLDRWRPHADAAVQTRVDAARRDLTAAADRLALAVAPAALHIESGAVAERLAILAAPGYGRQPLLVMGRRTRADRQGTPGAIAYRILNRAPVPLLVHVPAATT